MNLALIHDSTMLHRHIVLEHINRSWTCHLLQSFWLALRKFALNSMCYSSDCLNEHGSSVKVRRRSITSLCGQAYSNCSTNACPSKEYHKQEDGILLHLSNLQILLIVVLMLSMSPKHYLNSSMNSPKSFNNGDPSSSNGINHAIVDPLTHVPINLLKMHQSRNKGDAYRWQNRTWFKNP